MQDKSLKILLCVEKMDLGKQELDMKEQQKKKIMETKEVASL